MFELKHTYKQIFLLLVLPLAMLISCKPKNANNIEELKKDTDANTAIIDSAFVKNITAATLSKALVEDGMLVTRSDDDFESLALMNFQKRERVYSHAGIAFKEDSNVYIYHSMTGIENPSGSCRRDLYDSFVNPLQKTGFGIFKYSFTEKEKALLHAFYKKQYLAKTPFDIYFNLENNDSLYCSEIVYKGIRAATNGRIKIPISVIKNFKPKVMGYNYKNTFYRTFEFIGIDDLYLNPFCKAIKRVQYK